MALVTLSEIKAWLGIADANTDQDAVLTAMQASVEQSIIDYAETQFAPTEVTGELHDGRRGDTLVPDFFPVISVQRVVFDVEPDGSGGADLDIDTDVVVRREEIVLRTQYAPQGRGRIRLDYTYGYTETPARVKMAVKLGVEAFYHRKSRRNIGVTSRGKQGESESYKGAWDPKTGLPTEVLGLLAEYRNIEFPTTNATRNY